MDKPIKDRKAEEMNCYHCGEPCVPVKIEHMDKSFCCEGCRMVYEILHSNELERYYDLEKQPGIQLKGRKSTNYEFLEDEEVRSQLISYSDEQITRIKFYFPQIHCSSCIWLLENLHRLGPGIVSVRVNFLKKEAVFTYENDQLSLRQLVELLASIGYAPEINLGQLDATRRPVVDRTLYYQLGLAGFAFGNIMMLSFPEYLGLHQSQFQSWFGYLNILLAVPVLVYCAKDYLLSAWWGVRQGQLNMDVPITLGILALFGRSIFEILTNTGSGYLDSLAGLVFFLLVGKWFQQKTYHTLNFERDYRSYFPIAVAVKKGNTFRSIPLSKVNVGDIISVRNEELIPTDGVLTKGTGQIDYSFVTGESNLVTKSAGEKLFAGGKQKGKSIEITVSKKVEQSYLTQLWNENTFKEEQDSSDTRLANTIGKYFTVVILGIATLTFVYWYARDLATAFNASTAVLIIACPCAVALAIPFTYGNVLRQLGRRNFFLKNVRVIEAIQQITQLVFDKTGTLTNAGEGSIKYEGEQLSEEEKTLVKSLSEQSAHPKSRRIALYFEPFSALPLTDFEELIGLGTKGRLNGHSIQLGSADFLAVNKNDSSLPAGGVYLAINGVLKGSFLFGNQYRPELNQVIEKLKARYNLSLLSGDNDRERTSLLRFFGNNAQLHFEQSPKEKLHYIKHLQKSGERVMMIGDGLNDAGALKQSDVGIVITEHLNNFTPASDAILAAEQFNRLPALIAFVRSSRLVVFATYGLALIYNIIGLSFAVQGLLSPVIAAILMPLSSITVVVFGVSLSTILSRRLKV